MNLDGITEQDIANYLASNPGFYERHPELLNVIQFPHPAGSRAISLQERQAQMLRERIKGLERRIIEMIRNGQENIGHFEKLQRWTLQQMTQTDPEQLHLQLREAFLIPGTALRLFGASGDAPWALPVSEGVRRQAEGLDEAYCGLNEGFEAAHWVEGMDGHAASLALVPLRKPGAAVSGSVFGLLVLASPDATRYSADKGLEFLQRVGEVASTALARFVPDAGGVAPA